MKLQYLKKIEQELKKLEGSYDICVEQSDDPIRLNESHLKLREIIRKHAEWREQVMNILNDINNR